MTKCDPRRAEEAVEKEGSYTFSVVGEFALYGTVEGGLISGWREYQYHSELLFEEFAGGGLRR